MIPSHLLVIDMFVEQWGHVTEMVSHKLDVIAIVNWTTIEIHWTVAAITRFS